MRVLPRYFQFVARGGSLVAAFASLLVASSSAAVASSVQPKVVDVPSRPAFVTPPQRLEMDAKPGQVLLQNTLLRTKKPGRMQVQLPGGRGFRLGGDALLRLTGQQLELKRGQIIAWINPGQKSGYPLRIRTPVATASITGTTVFIEAGDDQLKVFSWEGRVLVETDTGNRYTLSSGEQVTYDAAKGWQSARALTRAELDARRERSILLNGFNAVLETWPVIEKELGFTP